MRTLIIFPIFIMFILSLVSIAGNNTYYSNSSTFTTLGDSNSSLYGVQYYIMPNGTYVFNNPETLFAIVHYLNDYSVEYNFTWSEINYFDNNGYVHLNNGSTYNTARPPPHMSFEFFDWAEHFSSISYQSYWERTLVNQTGLAVMQGTTIFGLSAGQGYIIGIITIIGMATVIGVRAFSTGISNFAQEVIVKGTFYLAFWGILSVLAQPLIADIYFFGAILYLGLTIMYLFGFVGSLNSGGTNEE